LDKLTRLIEALSALYQEVGLVGSVIVVGVAVGGPVLASVLRDRKLAKAYTTALDAKEEQIQRLAEDNRAYRAFVFRKGGLTEGEVNHLLGPPSQKPSPLTAEETKKQKAKKKKDKDKDGDS
jgi:hypothetical protein